MKKINLIALALLCLLSFQISNAQLCSGVKGPNLLGAKGTFSDPYITVNTSASTCLRNGSFSYNPVGNVGNALTGCTGGIGDIIPCSDYTYSAVSDGLVPEFRYSLLKVVGDENGSNCINTVTPDPWKGKDHTQDGGYFLAVNGAPNDTYSPLFYQIKNIPVCVGTTYEFSAWVLSLVPGDDGTTDSNSPNISFLVNDVEIPSTGGPVPYSRSGKWVQRGGSFTATTPFVNLKVVNATAAAGGNDLGLDDISIRVCQSQILPSGPQFVEENSTVVPQFVVSDPVSQNTWYKWQLSTDGGNSWSDETNGDEAIFIGTSYTLTPPVGLIGVVEAAMNGFIYRLVVSTSKVGLGNPECIYFNDYRLLVVPAGTLPVQLASFDGTYSKGTSSIKWQTSQEINSDRFELFRSYDGTSFELAATVKAAGSSNTIKNYRHQDQVAGSFGKYVFYKLKQIDRDGRFTFSSIIKLGMDDVNKSLQLFPNPMADNFTASFSAPKASTATLIIRNPNGQSVYSKTINVIQGNNAVLVNNTSLKTGMYYVTIVNGDINYNGKLQKQ